MNIKGNIVSNANTLIEDLRKIVIATDQLSKKCYDYNEELEQHLVAYETLSPLGYLLPETAVDKMSKLAATLQQLEGVYEPLGLLIDALRSKANSASSENGFLPDVVSQAKTHLLAYTNHFEDQKGDIILSIYNLFVDLSPIKFVDDNVIGFKMT